MGDTSISWTDKTWNPVRGCSKVSPGCTHCYAERVALRFCGAGQPYHGLADRERGRWTGDVRLVPEHLADPLRWKKPCRIFVNSMSDLFHEKLTNDEIAAVFGVMAAAPHHKFQVLTKRSRRMREWFQWVANHGLEVLSVAAQQLSGSWVYAGNDSSLTPYLHFIRRLATHAEWPLPNVWNGVSVENQEAADDRIPDLLATPAAVRFLSCEPLLGPIDLRPFQTDWDDGFPRPPTTRVDWVIAGCESGAGARRCETAWLRSLRDQCTKASVPFFLKQAEGVDSRDSYGDVCTGPGSKMKPRGIIELPYLDGVQHKAWP